MHVFLALSLYALGLPVSVPYTVGVAGYHGEPRGSETSSLVFGDLDGDGSEDALAIGPDASITLLWSADDGRFEDLTRASGLAELGFATCAVFVDLDGDGDLDLFAGSSEGRLWRNLGNVAFEPFGVAHTGIDHGAVDLAVHAFDQDGDGRPDLHVHTDGGELFYRNTGGARFERIELSMSGPVDLPRPATRAKEPSLDAEPIDAAAVSDSEGGAPERVQRWRRWRAAAGARGSSAAAPDPGGSLELVSEESVLCLPGVQDQASGACLNASSVPALGRLYPLSQELFVDAATGRVGLGTTTPGYRLEVLGQIVSGTSNSAPGSGAVLGGGSNNVSSGLHSTVGGGNGNQALRDDATIAGGLLNLANGTRAAIAGGVGNRAGNSAAVGGGQSNDAQISFSTIAGGRYNTTGGTYAAIGGGANNQATGTFAVVGGGGDDAQAANGNVASGLAATVPGGRANVAAGATSFAAGQRAQALHDGSFVWADGTSADFATTAPDQFLVRAGGGMGVGKTPDPAYQLDVAGVVRASDTIVSSKPAGAPFLVASSDLNANLNADLLDGLDASDFSQFGALVDAQEIANGAVTSTKIQAGAVGTGALANDAVTLAKLDGSGGRGGQVIGHDGLGPVWTTPVPGVPTGTLIGTDSPSPPSGYTATGWSTPVTTGTESWTFRAPMALTLYGHTATEVGGRVYVVGGASSGSVRNLTEEYDPSTDTWTSKAPLPIGLYWHAAVNFNGYVYTFGGWDGSSVHTGIFRYDPVADSWGPFLGPLPPLLNAAACVHDGTIYLLGGQSGPGSSTRVADVYRLDLGSLLWVLVAPLPRAMTGLTAVSYGGSLYAFGGDTVVAAIYEYDSASDAWRKLVTMPANTLAYHSTDWIGREAIVVGGYLDGIQGTDQVWRFRPNTRFEPALTFPQLSPPSNVYLYDHASAVVGGTLYVFGGKNGDSGFSKQVLAYDPGIAEVHYHRKN